MSKFLSLDSAHLKYRNNLLMNLIGTYLNKCKTLLKHRISGNFELKATHKM